MRMSVCVMADIDEIGFYPHIESLGYDSAWVADSQMLYSDCYAVLALAARQTSRLRLGPGVAICGTRIPPVHVAAMATLNRLAPGRVHLGIGTGNTAMRSMGQPPMRIADYGEYLRVLRGLLQGDVVDYVYEGTRHPIKMLIREKKYMSLEPRIPLYVSAFGPRAMELAGQYGDGLVFAIPPRGLAPAEALALARVGARARRAHARGGLPHVRAHQHRPARAGRGGRLRARDPRGGAERDGQRLLLLRCGARARHRAAALPAAHLEALLRAGGGDAGRAPALPHPRGPLHLHPPGRGRADRRGPGARHLPGGLARRS